jgi:N-acetylmuramoyl-L-alanine amidase
MKKLTIPIIMLILLAVSFIAGQTVGANTSPVPGSEQDPLVTKSYLEQQLGQSSASMGETVILTRGDVPFDALAAAPLAQKFRAVVLLTSPQSLSAEAGRTIAALQPKNIYLIGGVAAVSQEIETQLKNSYPVAQITRIQGANRFETAEKIAALVTGKSW